MTLQELLTSLTRDLHAADTDAPALEARLLAGHVLHLDRIGLMLAMPSRRHPCPDRPPLRR